MGKENEQSELELPNWAVISFDRREAFGLTYEAAASKMSELERQNIAGLCIVTDEVAARVKG